jgi:hypothetical protein
MVSKNCRIWAASRYNVATDPGLWNCRST